MKKEEMLFLLDRIAQGVSQMFSDICEVVISDIDQPDHAILRIYNGHVTGRKVGDPLSNMGLKLSKTKDAQDYINYPAKTKDGRMLKCTTIQLKTEDAFFGFGINIDITNFAMAQNTLDQLMLMRTEFEDSFGDKPNDLLQTSIAQAIEAVGKPPAMMNKQDRMKVVQHLHQAGLLQIQKSVNEIAEALNISRYTVYNYLRELGSDAKK